MRWTIYRRGGGIAGFVVQWHFGFIAYDETEFQLGNFVDLCSARNAVLNPPNILREFDGEMTIKI